MKATHHQLMLLAVALGLVACKRHSEPNSASDATPVVTRVALASIRQTAAVEEVVGTVRSRLHSAVEAKVSGKIQRMLVTPGQSVKAGELLVELDAGEIKAKLAQALAVRDEAEQEFRRASGLIHQGAISQQEFDLAQSRARVAEATVVEHETMLGYTGIVAPFTAMVTRKAADVGDLAGPGKLLLELEDYSQLRLEADLPEALIDRVQLGQKFSVRIPTLTNVLEGTISEVTPVTDPTSRTFLVKFDLPATAGLRVGQFGRVLIPLVETTALLIPASAVVQRGQMELVFVAKDGRAHLRLVKTGKRIGDEAEVVSGLSSDEQVIREGAANVRDGQPIEIK